MEENQFHCRLVFDEIGLIAIQGLSLFRQFLPNDIIKWTIAAVFDWSYPWVNRR